MARSPRMMRIQLCVLAFLTAFTPVRSLDVLVSPWIGSHALNQLIVAEELHRRGHNVTILADSSIRRTLETRSPNWQLYRALEENEGFEVVWYDSTIDDLEELDRTVLEWQELPPWKGLPKILDFILDQCHGLITAEAVRGRTFDIFLYDKCFSCNNLVPGNVVHVTGGAVSTMVTGLMMMPGGSGEIYFHPAFTPALNSQLTDHMTFAERCANMVAAAVLMGLKHFMIQPRLQAVLRRAGLPIEADPPTYASQLGSLHLLTSHWGFENPAFHAPNLVSIGPLTTEPSKPVGGDLGAWMDAAAPSGVVVVSLGSTSFQSDDLLHAFASVAAGIVPARLLWKIRTAEERATAERLVAGLDTVLLVDWLPMNGVLAHHATRAAIVHCGMNTCQEAMFHGVPVVGIPQLGDQFDNCAKVRRAGFGLSIDKADVTRANVLAAVRRVLDEPSFAERAMWARRISRASPGLEGAVRAIEHAADVGVSHLNMRAANALGFWQAHCLDTLGLIVALAAAALALLWCAAKAGARAAMRVAQVQVQVQAAAAAKKIQ